MHYSKMCFIIFLLLGGIQLNAGSGEDGLVQMGGQWFVFEQGVKTGPILPDRIVVREAAGTEITVASLQARGHQGFLQVEPILGPFYLLTTPSNQSYASYQSLKSDSAYDLVEYDVLAQYAGVPCTEHPDGTPNDGFFPNQLNLQLHRVDEAWSITKGDPNVLVAVVDSGIDYFHQDLKDNIYVNPLEDLNGNGSPDFYPASAGGDIDFMDNDGDGYVDDLIGWNLHCSSAPNMPHIYGLDHGTAVAGIISAKTNNCWGLSGIAGGWGLGYPQNGTFERGVSLVPVRVFEDPNGESVASVLAGLSYAAAVGANVLNVSITWEPDVAFFREGLASLLDEYDLTICAAAGNNDATFSDIRYPGKYPGVLAIGLCQSNGVAPTSGYRHGPTMDLVAYGTLVDNFKATTLAGSETRSCPTPPTYSTHTYQNVGGTSIAAPHVSGTVGLMLSANGNLTAKQVEFILRATAVKLGMGTHYFTCNSGYGTLDTYAAVYEAAVQEIPDQINLTQPPGSQNLFQAYETITTGTGFQLSSSANLVLHAGGEIRLQPGTVISSGSNFRADVGYHETCPTLSAD